MKKYTAAIVGGGVAGLSCGLTLASSKGYLNLPQDMSFIIIDEGNSDLLKARLYCVPLAEHGADGEELLNKMKLQIKGLGNTDFINSSVCKIAGEKGNFNIETKSGEVYNAEFVILATGMQKFEIEGEGLETEEHTNVVKPGKVKIKSGEKNKVRDGIYSAGLAAGVPTMFACASGSGVETACALLSDIQGKITVIHDTPKSRNRE